MKFEYVELVGYRRFDLNDFTHFEMTITTPTQLILGTNGSGKSSLLSQINVLPGIPSDFHKGGRVVKKLEHRNNHYVLSSDFSKSSPHSFIFNDQELNDGGTITVQRELVKQYFGITNDVQNLIQGVETFTSMSPNRRKEWFIQLCDENYDFAIAVYNKLKERLRDVSGAIKIAKATLVQESEKLIQEETLVKLKEEVDILHEFLSTLLEIRKPVDEELSSLASTQSSLDSKLFETTQQLDKLTQKITTSLKKKEEYEKDILDANKDIDGCTAVINEWQQRHRLNSSKLEVLQKADRNSISELQELIREANARISQYKPQLIVAENIANPQTCLNAFQAISGAVASLTAELPTNPIVDGNRKYSYATLLNKRQELISVRGSLEQIKEELHANANKLEHMLKHKEEPDVQCPRCDHKFSTHYDELTYTVCIKKAETLTEEIKRLTTIENELHEYVDTCATYGNTSRQIQHLFTNVPELTHYLRWFKENGYLEDNPMSSTTGLAQIESDIIARINIQSAQILIAEKSAILESLVKLGSADYNTLAKENQEIDLMLSKITQRLSYANAAKSSALLELDTLTKITQYEATILNILKQKKSINKDTQETLRRTEFNKMIRNVQRDLSEKEKIIGTASLQAEVVRKLSEQIKTLTLEEQDISVIIKRLSPTEGLIAEGLLGFIKNFIDQMNTIIENIWSYELVIQSCEITDGETLDLDYRFPVKIHTQEKPIADVSKGSTGIIEIINLAYRLTAMHFLGMHDYPLYLDEAGSAFDPAHRSEFAKMLTSIVEQSTFSQVYLISHYFDLYGGLPNVETCVLSKLNITPPAVYNKHVVMK